MRAVALLLMLALVALSETAIQDDWSNGGGVFGPVTSWEESFLYASPSLNTVGGCLQLDLLTLVEHAVDIGFGTPRSMRGLDMDFDGDIDILAGGGMTYVEDVAWWENMDGAGEYWIKHGIGGIYGSSGANSVCPVDFDGDGDIDVVGASQEGFWMHWWENDGSMEPIWTEHNIVLGSLGVNSVVADDIDGDGDPDLVSAAFHADDISWWENTDGSGTNLLKHVVANGYDGASNATISDIDGDGDMDVAAAGWYEEKISWWENSDTSMGIYWTEHIIRENFDLALCVLSTDVDLDGDTDIVGGSYGSDGLIWLENADGSGTVWIEHTISQQFTSVISMQACDMDDDGDPDLLTAGFYMDEFSWWENTDGAGLNWSKHIVDDSFTRVSAVAYGDFDGDADMDVAAGSLTRNDILWWDVDHDHNTSGYLLSSILDAGYVAEWNGMQASS
ncbi:MAG: VCBS repeat-containing protein, partial [Candidatus Sabulitectum sp.]|nr:VCBS repeat-containing protein [Candidatus Sabulitectum sp.]